MIAEKDASKSDERHVKDRRNTNLLTQKKTGGKDIMGNRGMTNWKLGAFFVIALTLMTGLFSSTALAGDGDGTISVSLKLAGAADFVVSALEDSGLDRRYSHSRVCCWQ